MLALTKFKLCIAKVTATATATAITTYSPFGIFWGSTDETLLDLKLIFFVWASASRLDNILAQGICHHMVSIWFNTQKQSFSRFRIMPVQDCSNEEFLLSFRMQFCILSLASEGVPQKMNLKSQIQKPRKLGSEVGWFGVVYLVDQSHLMTEATAVPFLCRSSVYWKSSALAQSLARARNAMTVQAAAIWRNHGCNQLLTGWRHLQKGGQTSGLFRSARTSYLRLGAFQILLRVLFRK